MSLKSARISRTYLLVHERMIGKLAVCNSSKTRGAGALADFPKSAPSSHFSPRTSSESHFCLRRSSFLPRTIPIYLLLRTKRPSTMTDTEHIHDSTGERLRHVQVCLLDGSAHLLHHPGDGTHLHRTDDALQGRAPCPCLCCDLGRAHLAQHGGGRTSLLGRAASDRP